MTKTKVLIFIVAYNSEKFIDQVLHRIPHTLNNQYNIEILVIDDASTDKTFELAVATNINGDIPIKTTVFVNADNQGYGGNQKIGYWYAIENDFDYVALLHGDGQYAPENLIDLLSPLDKGKADVVLGSRMLTPSKAIKGGMPLYKFFGNRILTTVQNILLNSDLSEFHTGYRIYSVKVLSNIPFDLNTNDFHFDTEILIQLLITKQRIIEVPIPTYYGDEICHVNGLKYAYDVVHTTLKAYLQRFGLFYDKKFDFITENHIYQPKLGYRSPHSLTLKLIEPGSNVLDLGCAGGYLGEILIKEKQCNVTGVDIKPLGNTELTHFIIHDLDTGLPQINFSKFDYILLLDVIEHLKSPERLIADLREAVSHTTKIVVSTANVAFVVTRLSLMLGAFNYGKRGILDLTHLRLFTFSSIKNLFRMANYDIISVEGTPVPFPLVINNSTIAKILLKLNNILLFIHKRLFSFQSYLVTRPRPTLAHLLEIAKIEASERSTECMNG